MRVYSLLLPLALCCGAALAQAPAQISPQPLPAVPQQLQKQEQPAFPGDQRIERIRLEDAGSRIDELRVGGETQSITVQPKADVPEYEVLPADGKRGNRTAGRDSLLGSPGERVWNLLNF